MIELEQEAVSRWERGTRVPTLHRLQQLSDALGCSVDQLLQRGSKRPNDQLAMIADALSGLDDDERALVVNFVQQFADMLNAKRPRRGQRQK
ncbi:helix-turn-helix family protein [Burkholderia pseudomallei]|nr:helix-turn-helix family protein [Burkholderia pseudomallei]